MRRNWEGLSQLALSMGRCLWSGLLPAKALALSAAMVRSPHLARLIAEASEKCARGIPVSEALEPYRHKFPVFFLPVVRAGELSGRQVEAYELVHEDCERLKPTLRLVRNAWLYPLVCVVAGWIIQIGILLYFGRASMALTFARATFVNAGLTVAGAWLLLKLRWVRLGVDWLLLQIPFVRKTQVGLSTVLFFSTFRLGYEAGGLSVLNVFDLALETVSNQVMRLDLMKARSTLEESGTFEDAFAEPVLIEDWIKSSLTAGALGGHLGSSIDQIVRTEAAHLATCLELFNRIFQRLVGYSVAFSIVETVLMCVLSVPAK